MSSLERIGSNSGPHPEEDDRFEFGPLFIRAMGFYPNPRK